MYSYSQYCLILLLFVVNYEICAAEYKIGVVDARAVLEQAPQAEQMALELRQEFESRNLEMIEMRKQLNSLSEELTSNAVIMTQERISELERKQYLLSRDLARVEEEYAEDLSYRRNEILVTLQEEIIEAIRKVSLENNFDIVLSEGVNWASTKVNMTPLVIEYMRQKSAQNKQQNTRPASTSSE